MEALQSKQLQGPSIVQLRNYLTKIKKEKYGTATISLGEVEQWCLESSQTKLDLDAPFVVSYEVIYDDEFGDDEDVDAAFSYQQKGCSLQLPLPLTFMQTQLTN